MASRATTAGHPPLKRSSSLPTFYPDEVDYYSYDHSSEEEESDEEDSFYTEETDGSTPVDERFRSPLPSFGSVSSPEYLPSPHNGGTYTFGGLETARSPGLTNKKGACPQPGSINAEPYRVQVTKSGNFKVCEQLVIPACFDEAPPTKKDNRYSSCLDFTEFNNKIEKKYDNQHRPWSVQKPKFHQVKSPKKLSDLIARHPQANLNEKDNHGDTALHIYISEARKHRVELLITMLSSLKGVDINAQNISGHTPLHIAAMKNDLQSAIVLVVFGADSKIKDKFQLTPYDKAPDHTKLKTLLEKFTVDPNIIRRSPTPAPLSPVPQYTPDMIGYQLSCGRENMFALEMEKEILNMMSGREIDDHSEARATFMQLNHILRWKDTKGKNVKPGSRVLFLDGGGIRGLVLIEILIEIEKRTKQKITDLFDWIVGTSSGGIVALGLVYGGLTLSQIRGLFFHLSNRVFKEGLMGTWFQSVSNSREMNYILQDIFGTRKMHEVTEPKVLISTVSTHDSKLPLHFYNNYEPPSSPYSNVYVWEVARKTSAAPMYFTDYQGYIDGGVQANNPCEYGMNKIREYYEGLGMSLPHFPIMMSVGTGTFPSQPVDDMRLFVKTGLDGFEVVKNLFMLFMAAISKSEEKAAMFAKWCQSLNPEVPFFRFNCSFDKEIKPNETNKQLLIDMLLDTKSYMLRQDTMNDLFSVVNIFDELQSFSK